jgi:hypothetical protein
MRTTIEIEHDDGAEFYALIKDMLWFIDEGTFDDYERMDGSYNLGKIQVTPQEEE